MTVYLRMAKKKMYQDLLRILLLQVVLWMQVCMCHGNLEANLFHPQPHFLQGEVCTWEHPSAYPKWKQRQSRKSLVKSNQLEKEVSQDPDSEEIMEKPEAKPPTRFAEVLKLPPVCRGGPGEKPGVESSAGEAKEIASEEPSTPAKAKPLEAPSTAERIATPATGSKSRAERKKEKKAARKEEKKSRKNKRNMEASEDQGVRRKLDTAME